MLSSPPTKRLYRSRQDRLIAGVCGGIATYFNVDPTWVRLAFIIGFFVGIGSPFLIYIVMWLIVPLAPPDQPQLVKNDRSS